MRKISRKALYAGLLVAAGTGVAVHLAHNSCAPTIGAGASVCVIGDSFGVGLAPHLKALAKEAGAEVRSHAVVGATARDWLAPGRLQAALARQPNVVVISLGTNETAGRRTSQSLEADFRKLIAQIQKINPASKILWITPPTLPFEDRATQTIKSLDVGVFDSKSLDLPRGPDGLHPSATGYATWAGAIWAQATCRGVRAANGLGEAASFVRPVKPGTRARGRRHKILVPAGIFRQGR